MNIPGGFYPQINADERRFISRGLRFFLQVIHRPALVKSLLNSSPKILNQVFGALADPTRRGILELLSRRDRCAGELAKPYDMSLPAISQHLRVLETAGLIQRTRRGRIHQLRLETRRLRQAEAWIEKHRSAWENRLDRLEDYLKELQQKETKHEPKK